MKCAIILIGFQRFDEGTNVTLLDKPKFCTLAAEIFKKATL
jgi:hypothetical protein